MENEAFTPAVVTDEEDEEFFDAATERDSLDADGSTPSNEEETAAASAAAVGMGEDKPAAGNKNKDEACLSEAATLPPGHPPLPDLLNDDGFPVNFSQVDNEKEDGEDADDEGGESFRIYCGRRLGTDAIPESDGRCGPDDGPNCPSCRRLEENPTTRLKMLKRLFPRLASFKEEGVGASNDEEEDGLLLLVGLMRHCSGRFGEVVNYLRKVAGLKSVPKRVALSGKPLQVPPPHLLLGDDLAQRVETLRESLQVTGEEAEYALRNSEFDAHRAAEQLLTGLDGVQTAVVAESEERERQKIQAVKSNAKREAIIRKAFAESCDDPEVPDGADFPWLPDGSKPSCTGDATDEVPQEVIVVKGHRMVFVSEENGTESPFTCVLCASTVPSPTGGRYRCQACQLCEGCVQSVPPRDSDGRDGDGSGSEGLGVVYCCPGQLNGGHLHEHPLSFTNGTERSHCCCDLAELGGVGCLDQPVSWFCPECQFDVCRVCISRPPLDGYSRRRNRIIHHRPPTDADEEAGLDEDAAIRDFFSNIGGVFDQNDEDEEDDEPDQDATVDEFGFEPLTPRGPDPFQEETAEREAAAVWENASSEPTPRILLGTGAVGTTGNINNNNGDQERQAIQSPILPTEAPLSMEAAVALDRYRQGGASTVAAADVTHVEDLLRRAQAADNRLTSRAIRDALSAGRLSIAGTLLLSQAYAPVAATGTATAGANAGPDDRPSAEAKCWCGDVIDIKTSPDGAVGCLGGHAMHAACAADLLLGGGHCPTCRQPLFFSRVAGPEVEAAVEFAKSEIRRAQQEEKDRVQNEIRELTERGVGWFFEVGDVVLVSPDVELCRRAQTEDPIVGGWNEDMSPACGLEGLVTGLIEDSGRVVSVRVRSMGRHKYKTVKIVDDYSCPECNLVGPSTQTGQHRCRNCDQCETCCRRSLRSCPQNTQDLAWSPSVLTLLRRSGKLNVSHETVFDSEASAAIAKAERHILRLRGELIAVKQAREAVKAETEKLLSAMGHEKLSPLNISRELSSGSSAAVFDMAASAGVSAPDWQRARHLLLLARQWGDSEAAKRKRAALYSAVRSGDLDSVARLVRVYNATKTEEDAKWADAIHGNEYVVEPFAKVDLRAFPCLSAPRTGYSLEPRSHFSSKSEVLDGNGNVWLQVAVPSIDELASRDGMGVSHDCAKVGARVRRGTDFLENYGDQDGGEDKEGVITQVTNTYVYVRWIENGRHCLYPWTEDRNYLRFVGPPAPPAQGWLCMRPGGVRSRAIVALEGTNLRCFSCGDRLVPSKFSAEKYETVEGKSVQKGEGLLVAATLEPVTVEASQAGHILCSFATMQELSPDFNSNDCRVWYRPNDLVFPIAEGEDIDVDDEIVVVEGQARTRRELVLMCKGDDVAARKMWDAAKQEDKSKPTNFASCAKGHLLHARCFQGALVGGHSCPAAGCTEPLWYPKMVRNEDDDTQCCGGASRSAQAEAEAIQAASELAGHEALVAVRAAEGAGSQEEFVRAGFDDLRMCPLCSCGPLFNNECSDMSAHHGQCSVRALRSLSEVGSECTPGGIFQVPASEIAARVAQISASRSVTDVLPKCETHKALVMFNGCMACGHLFTDTSWNDLPKWDPSAKALLEADKKTRNAARLLTEQVRTEAALLQFERDALWEAGGDTFHVVGSASGWGGSGLDVIIEPPPIPPRPSAPTALDDFSGDY